MGVISWFINQRPYLGGPILYQSYLQLINANVARVLFWWLLNLEKLPEGSLDEQTKGASEFQDHIHFYEMKDTSPTPNVHQIVHTQHVPIASIPAQHHLKLWHPSGSVCHSRTPQKAPMPQPRYRLWRGTRFEKVRHENSLSTNVLDPFLLKPKNARTAVVLAWPR